MAEGTPTLAAFLAQAKPCRRAYLRRWLTAGADLMPAAAFGHSLKSGPRHAIIEAFVERGAVLVEETSRHRSGEFRVRVESRVKRAIGVPGERPWSSEALTPAGLEFAAYLIERRR